MTDNERIAIELAIEQLRGVDEYCHQFDKIRRAIGDRRSGFRMALGKR